MSIAVIGNIFVDIKGFPFGKYIADGRNAGEVKYIHGGVGRNVAEDLARLSLQPVFLSLADEGSMGDAVVSRLEKSGVDTEWIVRCANGMGTWLAVFNERGDIAGQISARPDSSPLGALLRKMGDRIFSEPDAVAFEFDMDGEDIAEPIVELSKKYNKKLYAVIANMSVALKRKHLLSSLECLVCNSEEAGILFDSDYLSLTPDVIRTVLKRDAQKLGMRSMVVTLGEQGAVYMDKDGAVGYCPAEKVEVCDTTGAGDAFFAGVVAGLTKGRTMADAVAFGTRLAASVIVTNENVCPVTEL